MVIPYEFIQRRSNKPKHSLQSSFSGFDAALMNLNVE
ncbi:hypothetical protein swp_3603 [Shewanella piezotolerans WP3]|uniref:Uncharacterized protein n=1 Tax=Shewanella piezotolerans (strain WP3 / JCM 13877) TaxID=225849 RepID=B8CQG4_SHEPW|nr:hypothetical protein swp_3603 [Shewanella piezotolerans WP3]